jgi:hypothetical protein
MAVRRKSLNFEHDLFRKPVPTFRDHAPPEAIGRSAACILRAGVRRAISAWPIKGHRDSFDQFQTRKY